MDKSSSERVHVEKQVYAQDQHYQSGCNGWIVQGPVISRLSAAVSSGMGSQNC